MMSRKGFHPSAERSPGGRWGGPRDAFGTPLSEVPLRLTVAAPPPALAALRATLLQGVRRVVLEWEPPEGVVPTKVYVLRFRVDPRTGAKRWARTHFVPGHHRRYEDELREAGLHRYYVGTLGPEGSGRPRTVDVEVPPTPSRRGS